MANNHIKISDLQIQNTIIGNTKFLTYNVDSNVTEFVALDSIVEKVSSYIVNSTIDLVRTSIGWFPTYFVYNTATSARDQVLDMFSATEFRSSKYTVQVTSGIEFQSSELLVLHDGEISSITEFGVLYSGSNRLCTFDSDLVADQVRLLVSPTNSISTIKVLKSQIPT